MPAEAPLVQLGPGPIAFERWYGSTSGALLIVTGESDPLPRVARSEHLDAVSRQPGFRGPWRLVDAVVRFI